MFFYALQFSSEQIYYAVPEIPGILFCARLKVRKIALAEKLLEHLEIGEIMCVHRAITLFTLAVQG